MIKSMIVLLFLITFFIAPQVYSYKLVYHNVVFDSKDIEKLTDSDSTLFLSILNEYTEYGAYLISGIIKYYGVSYKWGGLNENGVDCSGFVVNVFKSVEYDLPRTSKEQSKIGVYVPNDSLQLGDLLFFTTRGIVTHVGIYLTDDKFVHASRHNYKVCVAPIREFAFAKRVNT